MRLQLTLGVCVLMMSAAHAHAFTSVGDPREIPAETSVIPYWETVVVEPGDSIARGCEPFLAKVPSVTDLNCWRLVAGVNKLTSFTIQPGQRLLLPSAANTEAEVAARLAAYTAKAEAEAKDNAELQALADDPLGMASEIRRALVGYDQIAKKLAVLETETLDAAQTEEVVTKVLSLVDVVDKTALTASVEQALTAARARGDLTAFQVSDIITAQLALAGLSETAQMRAIVDAQTVRLDTLEATQQAQAATLTAHSTALEEQDGRIVAVEATLESQVMVLADQGGAIADLRTADETLRVTDQVLTSGLETVTARVATLEQARSPSLLPLILVVLVSVLALGAGAFMMWRQRNEVTSVKLAVENRITEVKRSVEAHHERIAVVETKVSSKKAIVIAADLEDRLRTLQQGSAHQAEVSVGDDIYIVTFTPPDRSSREDKMVSIHGVKDQTQSVHIERVRSVLLKAGGAGRFLVPKQAAAARMAA